MPAEIVVGVITGKDYMALLDRRRKVEMIGDDHPIHRINGAGMTLGPNEKGELEADFVFATSDVEGLKAMVLALEPEATFIVLEDEDEEEGQ